jgi:hypothetical protein
MHYKKWGVTSSSVVVWWRPTEGRGPSPRWSATISDILATERLSALSCFSFPAAPTPKINVLGGLALLDLGVREFLKKVRLLVKVWQRRRWICCPTSRRHSSFFTGKNFL